MKLHQSSLELRSEELMPLSFKKTGYFALESGPERR